MRIHKNVETIALGYAQHRDSVLYPFFVVFSWASVFYGLPRENVPDCIVSISLQPSEVGVRIVS
jgi:hypothetical protein